MTKLFAHISASLDGYIDDHAGDSGFFPMDQSFHDHIIAMLSSIGGMVFGRTAFDMVAKFWPTAQKIGDENFSREAEYMNKLPKYVLTHRPLDTTWAESRAVGMDDLRAIKSRTEQPIAVFAGVAAIESVLSAGILDEIRILRQPVILGGGHVLFSKFRRRVNVRRLESHALTTGAQLETYEIP